jgi:hypothetical protein
MYYELNFTESLEPVAISPPAECSTADPTSSTIPLLEDAYDIFSMGSELTTYETNFSFDEAVEFYKTEMAALGWTFESGESFVTSPSAFLAFTDSEGKNVLIVIGQSTTSEEGLSIVITES